MKRTFLTALVLTGLLGLKPPAALPQSADAGPALGVARISLVNGDVSTRRGDSGDWVAAGVNTAVVEGDTVQTGPGSRAEIQLDYSNLIRLDGSAEVEIASLGNRAFRVRVFNGRITYSELRGGEADVDIETPLVAIRPQKNGRYEIEVGPAETVLQVRRGEAEVFSDGGSENVDRGRMLIAREGPDGLQVRVAGDEPRGEWDRWNESRDDRLTKSTSYRYVSRSVVGADDLDYYGDWQYVSGYGHCWYPRGVSVGWSPYSYGRWSWVGSYGWTWIGYEPWGWAPYHYGRWFHHARRGWGWYPGPRYHYNPWRPAQVAFFGFGGSNWNVGVGVGFGRVGWVPLAPGEPYYPWYGGRYGNGYGRGGNVKIKNSTIVVDNSVNVYNTYRNARTGNGVQVVDADGFSRGQLNNRGSLRADELRRASLVRGQIPVVPARQAQGSIRAANSVRASSARPSTFSRNGVRASSDRPVRQSFDQQRDQIATSVRQYQSGVRAANGRAPDANAAARSNSVRSSTASGGAASVRSGVRSTAPSGVRSGTAEAPSRAPSSVRSSSAVRSTGAVRSNDTTRWRRLGDANASRSPTPRANSSVRSSNSTRSTDGVRSSQRSATSGTRQAPSVRSNSPARETATAPRSRSRVDRSDSSNRGSSSGVRSGSATRAAPTIQRRNNRIDDSPSSRAPSANRSRTATAPSRSSSRAARAPSTRSAPSASRSSSRRSAPSARSAPSRAPRATAPSTSRSSSRRSAAPALPAPPRGNPRLESVRLRVVRRA